MPDEYTISSMTLSSGITNDDLMELATPDQSSETGYTSVSATVVMLAIKMLKGILFSSDLNTTDKTIIGAINEILAGGGGGSASILYGTTAPSSSQGEDGNLYVQYTEGTGGADDTVDALFVKLDGAWCQISTGGGGGGTSNYNDLANKPQINSVELSGNKSLDDLGIQPSEISKTASGSIATFSDGGDDIPVSEYECEIVAQQASGTPTPDNPLPITGFSQADIVACGKNFFLHSGVIDPRNVTYSVSGNNITLTATAVVGNQQQLLMYLDSKIFSGKTITFSYDSATSSDSSAFPYVYLSVNGTTVKSLTVPSQKTFTHTLPSSYTSAILLLRMYQGGSVSVNSTLTISKCQLEISNEQTTFEPFGNLYTVAFGQSIYGGRLIYKDGQWSIEAISDIFTPTNTSTIVGQARITNGWAFTISNAPQIYKQGGYAISNINIVDDYSSMTVSGFAKVLSNRPVFVLMDSDSGLDNTATQEQIKTAFQTFVSTYNPVAVYELATPTVTPITSSTRVKTISGVNNIFSNTGDNSVKYFTENADSLAELIKASESESTGDYHEYSTEEKIVGKWIDGSTLYEKTYTSSTYYYTTAVAILDLSSLAYDKITSLQVESELTIAGEGLMYFMPSSDNAYMNTDKKVYAKQSLASAQSGRTMQSYITIQYTKSS